MKQEPDAFQLIPNRKVSFVSRFFYHIICAHPFWWTNRCHGHSI